LVDRIELGSVDDEIRMVRVLLNQALARQRTLDEVPNPEDQLEVSEVTILETETTITRTRRDTERQVLNYLRLVGQLEGVRKYLSERPAPHAGENIALAVSIRVALDNLVAKPDDRAGALEQLVGRVTHV